MPTFNPIQEHFPATYKIIFRTYRGRVQVCLGSERTMERNWGNPDGCKFWKRDNAMRMMTWQDATHKRMTWQQQRITGKHLAHRSRGVSTRHGYERISSRDLEWQRRENRREREEVKLSCSFDKRVKPKNLEKVKPFWEKNTTEINEVESTPLAKRNKEEQLWAALRLRRDARLDKMKRTWAKRHTSG